MRKVITGSVIAGAVALAASQFAADTAEAKDKEKCYGVVKAGHNDCGSADGKHSCIGEATVDASGQEWVAMPKGLCEKLVGGSLEPYAGTEKEG